MGRVIHASWPSKYEMMQSSNKRRELLGEPTYPACSDIAGEFLAFKDDAASPCAACKINGDCRDSVDFLFAEAKALGLDCIGKPEVHNILEPSTACEICRLNQECGDMIYAYQRRGLAMPGAVARHADSAGIVAPPVAVPEPIAVERHVTVASAPSETTAPYVAATTGASSMEYRFPDGDPIFRESLAKARANGDPKKLLGTIEKISFAERLLSGGLHPYADIRSRFCAISIALNELGVFPPFMRDTRRLVGLPPGKKRSAEESIVSNDLQVIDAHWASCKGFGRPIARWRSLLASKPFSFNMASQFVVSEGRAERKADILGFTTSEQRNLAVLHGGQVKDFLRGVKAGRKNVESRVRTANPRSRLPEDRALMMPVAYVALRFADASPQVAATLMPTLAGAETTPAVMRKCLTWLYSQNLLKADSPLAHSRLIAV